MPKYSKETRRWWRKNRQCYKKEFRHWAMSWYEEKHEAPPMPEPPPEPVPPDWYEPEPPEPDPAPVPDPIPAPPEPEPDPIPARDMPEMGMWSALWGEMFRSGTQAKALAVAYLDKLQGLGIKTAFISDSYQLHIATWAAEIIRAEGMKVGLIEAAMHNPWVSGVPSFKPSYGARADQMEIYHIGYAMDQHWQSMICPGYRGPRYYASLGKARTYMQALAPNFILCDDEIYRAPKLAESKVPGVVMNCARCGSLEAHEVNHVAVAEQLMTIAREANPDVKHFFWWGGLDWPTTVGAVIQPTFYNPPLEILRDYCRNGQDPATYYDWPTKGIIGSQPWVTIWQAGVNDGWQPDVDDGSYYVSQEDFYGMCKVLAEEGAHGVCINQGPFGIPYAVQNHTEYWDGLRWKLVETAIAAFRDHYSPAYRL